MKKAVENRKKRGKRAYCKTGKELIITNFIRGGDEYE
jgi:hypothetical protein